MICTRGNAPCITKDAPPSSVHGSHKCLPSPDHPGSPHCLGLIGPVAPLMCTSFAALNVCSLEHSMFGTTGIAAPGGKALGLDYFYVPSPELFIKVVEKEMGLGSSSSHTLPGSPMNACQR